MSQTQVVHRVRVAVVEAIIREEETGSYSVELTSVGSSEEAYSPARFARDDLLSVQEAARQAYEWICLAQGETVLMRKT